MYRDLIPCLLYTLFMCAFAISSPLFALFHLCACKRKEPESGSTRSIACTCFFSGCTDTFLSRPIHVGLLRPARSPRGCPEICEQVGARLGGLEEKKKSSLGVSPQDRSLTHKTGTICQKLLCPVWSWHVGDSRCLLYFYSEHVGA